MASPTLRSTAPCAFGLLLSLLCLVCGAEGVLADDNERWPAPFGGFFNASFTFATDYSFAGISQRSAQRRRKTFCASPACA